MDIILLKIIENMNNILHIYTDLIQRSILRRNFCRKRLQKVTDNYNQSWRP